ncbi:MAG: hypothetical protein ACLSVD_10040 [Eggerthellaceae bacterium]
MLAAGTLAFAACDAGTPEWAITVLYGVRTVGVACLMMPMTAHACAALSLEDIAQGTAIITSFRQIFGALSSSALITVMALASSNELGIDVGGFALSFEVQAAIIVVGRRGHGVSAAPWLENALEAARLSVVRAMLRLPGRLGVAGLM